MKTQTGLETRLVTMRLVMKRRRRRVQMPLAMRLEKRNASEEEEKGKGGIYLWLLDRDGVINEDVGSPGVIDVDRFKFLPLVKESLWSIRRRQNVDESPTSKTNAAVRKVVCLITNQTCVGKEIITEAYLTDVIHKRMTEELSRGGGADAFFDAILYETSPAEGNNRRKPAPGMVLEALQMFPPNTPGKDGVIFVGDSMTDMMAAGRAEIESGRSITRVLVGTGYGSRVWSELRVAEEYEEELIDDGVFYYYVESERNDVNKESSLDAFPEECFPLYVAKDLAAAVDIFL
jgi:histidinol phosphatase-like enzyme